MQELPLVTRHRLEPESLLFGALGEDPELALLRLGPGEILLEEPKGDV
jgi:hypothetical protein